MTFYTDGGALWPTFPEARVASWSVVQDTSSSAFSKEVSAQVALAHPTVFPCFKVVALGPVTGAQTAGRGELYAMVYAVKSACRLPVDKHVRFVTDSQYVVSIITKIQTSGMAWVTYKTLHADLIEELYRFWDMQRFYVFKIKSHQKPEAAKSFPQLWDILGNACADKGATAALHNLPSSVLQLHKDQKD